MKSILTKLGIIILKGISRLPFAVLYIISDFLFIVFYRLIKYRIRVVRSNLKNSFPDKNENELRLIERNFYKYLADLVVEVVKGFTISKKEILRRVKYNNREVYDYLYDNRKSAIAVMGHNGNWEWVCRSAQMVMKNRMFVAYKPLSNPEFDSLMEKTRTEFGMHQISMAQVPRFINSQTEPFLLILVADQSPSDPKTSIWTKFLNQETAVLPGVEKLANKFNLPVIFHEVRRLKRGYYECNAKLIIEKPNECEPKQITRIHTAYLEQKIREQPETWLWSHRRWKLKNV